MDDLNHNCASCHEVTRTPSEHHCGRTPEGTLPAHQPHKAATVNAMPDLLGALLKAIQRPYTQDDYTIAGPSEDD